jgi:hypothetical protein
MHLQSLTVHPHRSSAGKVRDNNQNYYVIGFRIDRQAGAELEENEAVRRELTSIRQVQKWKSEKDLRPVPGRMVRGKRDIQAFSKRRF